MNLKGMILSIVTVMVVIGIFAIGPASAGTSHITKTANVTQCDVGDVINYTISVYNNDTVYYWNFVVNDTYAGHSEVTIATVNNLLPQTTWIGYFECSVTQGDIDDGWVKNMAMYSGNDEQGKSVEGLCEEWVRVPVDVAFTCEATGCEVLTFYPTYSGPVTWHQWIIDGHNCEIAAGPPTSKVYPFTSCGGPKSATLKGGPDVVYPANHEAFTNDSIYVACEPIVTVKRSPPASQCVEIGDSVTFSIDSLTNETPLASYEWTFTHGIAGSGVLPWPPDGDVSITRTIPTQDGTKATLTVVDKLGCDDEDYVTVCVDPLQEVPLLTLPGLLALIGMMCIVGAGRILTKGRRS
jgi:uncharacterized repeat protein (TIGR01451 family)